MTFDPLTDPPSSTPYGLKEIELITEEAEEEDHEVQEEQEEEEDEEEEEMAKYLKMDKEGKTGGSLSIPAEVEGDAAAATDESMSRFKEVVSHSPDQVLRYSRGGNPLWISAENRLSPKDVPNCDSCGGVRIFEFQIMPQLLASLDLDNGDEEGIDWGILAVYTCQESCNDHKDEKNLEYKSEFIYRQMPSDKSNL